MLTDGETLAGYGFGVGPLDQTVNCLPSVCSRTGIEKQMFRRA